MILLLLAAFASAQVTFTQKNIQQSNFFFSHSELYKYAESGIALAQHDLKYTLSGFGDLVRARTGFHDRPSREGGNVLLFALLISVGVFADGSPSLRVSKSVTVFPRN